MRSDVDVYIDICVGAMSPRPPPRAADAGRQGVAGLAGLVRIPCCNRLFQREWIGAWELYTMNISHI